MGRRHRLPSRCPVLDGEPEPRREEQKRLRYTCVMDVAAGLQPSGEASAGSRPARQHPSLPPSLHLPFPLPLPALGPPCHCLRVQCLLLQRMQTRRDALCAASPSAVPPSASFACFLPPFPPSASMQGPAGHINQIYPKGVLGLRPSVCQASVGGAPQLHPRAVAQGLASLLAASARASGPLHLQPCPCTQPFRPGRRCHSLPGVYDFSCHKSGSKSLLSAC